jgi:alpha-L-fucosidase
MTKASVISTSLLLLLSIAPASAGPCADEINNLSKLMASRDAGSGPTVGAASSPSSRTTQSQGGETQQHPPTATMSKETEGRATSPEDVQRQTTGRPTAAEQSQRAASDTGQQPAVEALNRARMLDQQGNEAECMAAVQQAKQFSGSQ